MKKPLFSIVCISKNESKTLPRLGASLGEFLKLGGDWVVVDTGSTDDTVKVAKSLGARVFEKGFLCGIGDDEAQEINAKIVDGEAPVVNTDDTLFDFASARNYAASLAKTDFVWQVDCDEVFTKLDIKAIDKAIKSNDNLERIENDFVFSHLPDGTPAIRFLHSKLYDRTYLGWRNMVHECLFPIGSKHGRSIYLGPDIIGLEHFQNHETNRGGYLRGLALDTHLNPDNDRNAHYYARELLWCGRPKSAIREFERHISMRRWPTEAAQSMIFIGDSYRVLGYNEKAIEWYWRSWNFEPRRREALMKLAGLHLERREWLKVDCIAEMALHIPEVSFYANNAEHYTTKPHEFLYKTKFELGEKEGSAAHLEKCIEYQPFNGAWLNERDKYNPLPQGWFNWKDQQTYRYMLSQLKDGSTFVELGVWKGRSLCSVADIMKKKDLTALAVDTFAGTENEGDAHKEAKEVDLLKEFRSNLEKYGIGDRVIPMKYTTLEAAAVVTSKHPLVFIDADHSEDAVTKDIEAWRKKILPGGYIMGHDFQWQSVQNAVKKSFDGKELTDGGNIWYTQL